MGEPEKMGVPGTKFSIFYAFAVLGLILNVAVLCSGGITSSFVRLDEKAVDMPLDVDVFRVPPGYNAPQQVHITQGDHDGKAVIVSWVTMDEPGSKNVRYWAENSKHKDEAKGIVTKYKFYNYTSGYIHHCTIKNLQYNTKYYYEVGIDHTSRIFWFTTPPEVGPDVPYIFGLIGDLGQSFDSNKTLTHYESNTAKGQAVLFVGDLSYADNYPNHDNGRWDTWGRFVERSVAYQPWIWTAGNHEIDFEPEIPFPLSSAKCSWKNGEGLGDSCMVIKRVLFFKIPWLMNGLREKIRPISNLARASARLRQIPRESILFGSLFSEARDIKLTGETKPFKPYSHRYHTPYKASESTSPFWYSIKRGPAYIIVLASYSAYGKYTPQYRWLESELPKVNRSETPWLIVLMHSPWYNSYNYHFMEGETMRVMYEPWFVKHKVDVVFAGHVHAYERSERVSNIAYNVVNGLCSPISDLSAPVYITIGDGGNLEGLATNMTEPQPRYSAYREASFGHATFDIKNRTHAHYAWHRNQDGFPVEADSMWFSNRYWHPVDDSTATSKS